MEEVEGSGRGRLPSYVGLEVDSPGTRAAYCTRKRITYCVQYGVASFRKCGLFFYLFLLVFSGFQGVKFGMMSDGRTRVTVAAALTASLCNSRVTGRWCRVVVPGKRHHDGLVPVWCGAGGGCDGGDVVMAMLQQRWAWRGGALIAGPFSASGALLRASARVSWRNRGGFLFRCGISTSQGSALPKVEGVHGWQQILDRPWLLPSAATKTTKVAAEGELQGAGFHVIRDDLLHPIMGGNKLRKLDALIPLLQAHGVTDVVTCGGCQSAHTAAVAVACAEVGMKAHLLIRGEKPANPTGYNLVAGMYGYVTYVLRSEYADRQTMLRKHAMRVAGDPSCVISLNKLTESSTPGNTKRVAILNEGAGDCHAILGLIRLVNYLSQPSRFGTEEPLRIVVDCGTGTTAIGLALGIVLNGLPWQVVGVMLADTQEGYEKQADRLLSEFSQEYAAHTCEVDLCRKGSDLPLIWRKRCQPRKFGRILPGEVETCQGIARKTGILLDPIYTLAGWEMARKLCHDTGAGDGEVVLLHTGGTLGLFGLAQRYPLQF